MNWCGTRTRVVPLTFNRAFLFITLFCFLTSLPAFADSCDFFKKKFLAENQFSEADMLKFKSEVESEESLCSKNLLGILFYKGLYFKKDTEKAEQIFFDLSNKGYPESSLNFALLMSKRTDQNPSNVIALLLGIYKSFASDEQNSHLASKARDVARAYVEKLPEMANQCNALAKQACDESFAQLNSADVESISNTFELSLRNLQAEVALNAMNETRAARERVDNVMSLLGIGLLAYNAASIARVGNASFNSPSSSAPNPWFNYKQGFGNPLGLYQFNLH